MRSDQIDYFNGWYDRPKQFFPIFPGSTSIGGPSKSLIVVINLLRWIRDTWTKVFRLWGKHAYHCTHTLAGTHCRYCRHNKKGSNRWFKRLKDERKEREEETKEQKRGRENENSTKKEKAYLLSKKIFLWKFLSAKFRSLRMSSKILKQF